jgi:hypothetical protein
MMPTPLTKDAYRLSWLSAGSADACVLIQISRAVTVQKQFAEPGSVPAAQPDLCLPAVILAKSITPPTLRATRTSKPAAKSP